MIEEIKLPEISENVKSGEVLEILVKVGDFIEKEQPVIELETEKASFEVPSPVSGKVVEVTVKPGQEVKVGQTVIKIDTEAKQEQKKTEPAEEAKSQKDESFDEQEPESKPPKEKPSKIEAGTAEQIDEAEQLKPAGKETKQQSSSAVSASPSVRHLANELGIDINEVSGSGPDGRILAEDVKIHAKSLIAAGPMPGYAKSRKNLPDFSKWGDIERQPMTAMRRKIADTLSYAWSNVPHVTQYDQADITDLEKFRHEYSQKVEQSGGRLTITSIMLKVIASALKEFPIFNASLDEEKEEIIYKKYCHISVAVDTDRGLLVPVIRDADKKNILELSIELTQLAEKTRLHKVVPEDMVGGNFTITNLGSIGGTNFSLIIYWPQVAILGLAKAKQKPVFIDGGFEPRMILPLSLSYDHRVIDGTEGLRFLRWIIEAIEKPFLLAMQGAAK